MGNGYGQAIGTGDRAPKGTAFNQGGNSYTDWGSGRVAALGNSGGFQSSGWQSPQTSGGGGFQASGWNNSGTNGTADGSAFAKAAAQSQLFQQAKDPVNTDNKASTNTNPSDTKAVTNNTISQFGDIVNSLFGANNQATRSQVGWLKDLTGNALQNSNAAENNRHKNEMEKDFRNAGYLASAAATARTKPLSFADEVAQSNAKLSQQYQKDQEQATERFKANSSANAMLGSAQAAADASKYAAGQNAQAGIFGSLFGSISNAGGGISRYW